MLRLKRAEGQYGWLVFVILGVLLLVTVIPLLAGTKDKSGELLTHTGCAQSIDAASKMKLGGLDLSVGLKCPLEYEKPLDRTKEDAMKLLTNRLTLVWDEFKGGEAQVFPSQLLDQESFCVFRYVEEFKNGDKIGKIPIDELITSMKGTYIKRRGEEIDVYSYLRGKKTAELDDLDLDTLGLFSLDTTKPLAIVIVYTKYSELNMFFAKWGTAGLIAGGVAGVVIGVAATIATKGALASVGAQAITLGTTMIVGAIGGTAGAITGSYAAGAFAIASGKGYDEGYDVGIMIIEYNRDKLEDLPCTYLPAEQGQLTGGVGEE